MVWVRIEYDNLALRSKMKALGALWRPRHKLWELPWGAVVALGIEHRLVSNNEDQQHNERRFRSPLELSLTQLGLHWLTELLAPCDWALMRQNWDVRFRLTLYVIDVQYANVQLHRNEAVLSLAWRVFDR
jgi:hypothetical protein